MIASDYSMSNSGAYRQHANATTRAHSKNRISSLSGLIYISWGTAPYEMWRSRNHRTSGRALGAAGTETGALAAILKADTRRTRMLSSPGIWTGRSEQVENLLCVALAVCSDDTFFAVLHEHE